VSLNWSCSAAGQGRSKAGDVVHQTTARREGLSVCLPELYASPFLPSFLALGLTYDEVISFVPPPLDQEEMES
jgi:hypothetical protein